MGVPLQTIAVIGHGRSPEGRSWGGRIDSCDFVVRMWNWHWQTDADYGTRYDVGLLEVHRITIRDWLDHNKHIPKVGWIASMLSRYREMANELPADTKIIDQQIYLKQAHRADRGCGETGEWQLTRGGIAACWAISHARQGDKVVLVGFDVIKAGIAAPVEEAFSPEYLSSSGFFGMGAYKPGKTKEGNHDYPAERNLLHFLADRVGVELHFAQDVWE
jgi:hypothetical protein